MVAALATTSVVCYVARLRRTSSLQLGSFVLAIAAVAAVICLSTGSVAFGLATVPVTAVIVTGVVVLKGYSLVRTPVDGWDTLFVRGDLLGVTITPLSILFVINPSLALGVLLTAMAMGGCMWAALRWPGELWWIPTPIGHLTVAPPPPHK